MTSWRPEDVTRSLQWASWVEATLERLSEAGIFPKVSARLSPLLAGYLICCGSLHLDLQGLRAAESLLRDRLLANPHLSPPQRALLGAPSGHKDLEAAASDLLRSLKPRAAAQVLLRTEAALLWRHLRHLETCGGQQAVTAFLTLVAESVGLEALLRWLFERQEPEGRAEEEVAAVAAWLAPRLAAEEARKALWRLSPALCGAAAFGVARKGGLWGCYEAALAQDEGEEREGEVERHLTFWGRRGETRGE